jgi:uncharacterized protein YjbI with pentapeptide repeats
MLKDSVQTWNGLRKTDPARIPDLSSADLEGRDLNGADLREVDFRGAYLNGTKLAGADLRRADLRRAHLTYADLTDANLTGADLRGADLQGAELQGATLEGALVAGTILDPECWTKPMLASLSCTKVNRMPVPSCRTCDLLSARVTASTTLYVKLRGQLSIAKLTDGAVRVSALNTLVDQAEINRERAVEEYTQHKDGHADAGKA